MDKTSLPAEFVAAATPDLEFAAVGLVLGGDVLEFRANAAQLDYMIEMLGNARAALKDQVPGVPDRAVNMRSVEEPAMVFGSNKATGMVALAIRDPAYSWTQYLLTAETARRTGAALLQGLTH